ncbi:MAG: hypothetical protein GY765_04510 [bacterium]|nr:hypothetical protein [bacterium]
MHGLSRLLYRLLKYKSFRVCRFFYYLHSSITKCDNSLLLTRICYEGHHLEKAVKRQNSNTRGKERARRLSRLVEEANKRNCGNQQLLKWAEAIRAAFQLKQETKEMRLERVTERDTATSEPGVMEALLNRKSIRFWLPRSVKPPVVEKIIEAGLNGPLSCNRQAIRVGVVANETQHMVPGSAANKSMMAKAPLILYIAVDRRMYYEKYAPALDTGSFCANALLAAEALGTAGCWIYQCEAANQRKLRKRFGLSRSYYFYSALLIGYPAENAHKPPRKTVESVMA